MLTRFFMFLIALGISYMVAMAIFILEKTGDRRVECTLECTPKLRQR